MQNPRDLKILPVTATRRGRPPIGVGVKVPDGLTVELPEAAAEPLVRCIEERAGKPIGSLEIDLFAANLIVDPERAIAEVARNALVRMCGGGTARGRAPVEFEMEGGVHGVRLHADLVRGVDGQRPPLPYLTVVALAGASVRGGVVVTMRAAADTWDAGDQVVDSIVVLDRDAGARGGGAMPLARR